MIVLGCDVGAMAAKIVLLENGNLIGHKIAAAEGKIAEVVDTSIDRLLAATGIGMKDIHECGGTGRGEKYISFAHTGEGLMNCLARGGLWAVPEARTIVDMGGLAGTVLSINEKGKVLEYRSNDRCAAGTGFFLELAAQALELTVDELGPLSRQAKGRVQISSQCAVFRESEIVTHVNEGKDVADIVAGINHALGLAAATMVRRLGAKPEIVVTGGVAKNEGVVKALEANVGMEIKAAGTDPQLIGAIGAALGAASSSQRRETG
ncbi:MAG: acyl-CoA dehydratase activase [Desulfomonilaceae bacterium]|nr:acyl-CoA dehydratase activase [Desulfomonilaceae bacterium]